MHLDILFYFILFLFIFKIIYLFIYLFIYFYFWLCWVFVSVRGLSLVAASGGHSSSRCAGLSLSRPLLLWSTGSRRVGSVVAARGFQSTGSVAVVCGLSSCGSWALEHRLSSCGVRAQQLWLVGCRAQAQQLWCMGLVAPRYVGSSWTRARTRVPCIGRRILNHCTTRKAHKVALKE